MDDDDEGFTYNINEIKQAIGATVTDLSNILCVSRQAIYGWINGSGMTPENAAKLRELSKAAYVFDTAKVRPNSYMLNRAIMNGRSFVQLTAKAACAEAMAKRLVEIVLREDRQRAAFARRFTQRPRPDFADAGVPHLREDAQ